MVSFRTGRRKEIYPTIRKKERKEKGLWWIGKPALIIFSFLLACINSRFFLYDPCLLKSKCAPLYTFSSSSQPFQLVLPFSTFGFFFPFPVCRRWMGSHSAVAYGYLRNIFTYIPL